MLAPDRRAEQLDYLENLLLSGAPSMTRQGLADSETIAALKRAFAAVRVAPEVDFFYSAVRVTCRSDSA